MGGGGDDGALTRISKAGIVSACVGGALGSIAAAWAPVPMAERGDASGRKPSMRTAFRSTGRMIGAYSGLFAAVGAAYAAGDVIAETVRGSDEGVENSIVGSICAGSVLGLRARSWKVAIGASLAMATLNAMFELNDKRIGRDPATIPDVYGPRNETKHPTGMRKLE